MTPYKAIGLLSVLGGIIACMFAFFIMSAIMIAPIGIVSGGIAVYKGQKLLGWIGIGLSITAIIIAILVLWHWRWFEAGTWGN